jgi:hypothetical protein
MYSWFQVASLRLARITDGACCSLNRHSLDCRAFEGDFLPHWGVPQQYWDNDVYFGNEFSGLAASQG